MRLSLFRCIFSERGQQRSRIPFLPSPPSLRKNNLAVLGHLNHYGARCSRLFVPRSPDQQLQQHRSQIDSLFRKTIVNLSSVCLLSLGGNDPHRLKLLQTISQNIAGNALA